ncbi:MAG: hypothetical protein EOP07_15480 [Proteobacteria bacterium]|nr:MAG: hypothetical protein EOP07_15480 [Pseudomonadota bacterium]
MGRFEVTLGGESNSNSPSADGTVSLESIGNEPSSEEGATSEAKAAANSAVVKSVFGEADESALSAGAEDGAKGEAGVANGGSYQGADVSDQQTLDLCSKLFRGKAKNIRLVRASDASSSLRTGANTVLAVRLSGNQSQLKLNIGGTEKLAGLCIVATGNQPQSDISSSADIGQIVYVARGNKSQAHFAFTSARLDSAFVDLRGHAHRVSFKGIGPETCDTIDPDQSQTSIQCE